MPRKKWFDEERVLPSPWEWIVIILFSAAIAGFGLLVYRLVPDGPRYWDFGQLPDAPAESIYSTEEPRRAAKVKRQLPMLPEAQLGGERKPGNEPLRERGSRR